MQYKIIPSRQPKDYTKVQHFSEKMSEKNDIDKTARGRFVV